MGRQVTDLSASSEFQQILDRVITERTSPIAARIVTMRLLDGESFEDIAHKVAYSESGVRQICSRALSDLRRDPPEALRAFLHSDFARILSALDLDNSASDLLSRGSGMRGMWCDRHKCEITFTKERWIAACAMCPCPIESADSGNARVGRPRRYCSPACRQAAARFRAKVLRNQARERRQREMQQHLANPHRTAFRWV